MLFKENKYTAIYFKIIYNAQIRVLDKNTYTEKHHIIPKSLGGTNDKVNLVDLTAKEHYLCHRLLVKIVTLDHLKKMKYALYCLTHVKNKNQKQRYIPSSNIYAQIKEEWRASIKGRVPWNKGIPMTENQKEKLRKANLNKTYNRSQEYLEKQSNAQKGKSRGKGRVSNRKGIIMSAEQKEKIRISSLGKKRSDETRQKHLDNWAKRKEKKLST